MQSDAKTVTEYLASLPDDRRAAIKAVRSIIKKNLPRGYAEGMDYGMINYFVPLERYPDTYNRKPLSYVALGSQKNHLALYLTCVYVDESGDEKFRKAWAKTGKKLDMGKGCLRFRKVDDLALDVIGKQIAATSVDAFIKNYERSREARRS